MKLHARGIGHGFADAEVIVSHNPISFLGGVDPNTGKIVDKGSDIYDRSFAGKILAFPHGKGSTVGSYVIFQLKRSKTAPAAILNTKAETIVATGAILAEIPMLDRIPMDILLTGDRVIVRAEEGILELPDVEENTVVTVIIKKDNEILILKRSEKVETYKGRWSGVSGGINHGEEPIDAAIRELKEETGIEIERSAISIQGHTIFARDGNDLWKVHPFLIESKEDEVSLDWENDEYRWIKPADLKLYETVPKLDRAVESLLKAEEAMKTKPC